MERKWTMQNVDLELLTVKLGDFFKERKFEVLGEKTPANYQITAGNSPSFKLLGIAKVIIEGNPNDFSIKLEFEEKRRRYSRYGSILLSLFGGGILVRQEARSDEDWFKLEKEFWPHVENLVSDLTNTAKSTGNNEGG
jgi:hypothetical protein